MKDSREIIQKQVAERTELERPFEPQFSSANGGYGAYREIYAQEGMQLKDYWRAVRKRLWLVIGVTVFDHHSGSDLYGAASKHFSGKSNSPG